MENKGKKIKPLAGTDGSELKSIKDSLMTNDNTQKIIEQGNTKIVEINNNKTDLRTDNEKTQEVVEELNKKHAVVHIDQFSILTEKGSDFTLEGRQSFINTYENQTVEIKGKQVNKATLWLKQLGRRQYDGITFDPTKTEHVEGQYNIWKGFAIKPEKEDCSRYKKHIEEVICSGNKEYFQYVWNWLAHLIQKPDKLSPALVLMGGQGVGKNTFVDPIGSIFGPHYLPLDNINQLLGNFNFFQKNAVLIHANEACWGGNKQSLGKLKAMVTEEHCMIEGKGKDQIRMKNFKHIILSSNEDWPVYMERDARRFLVLSVSSKHKGDKNYFREIRDELSNGGLKALLYELLNEDITDFFPWDLPQNREAFEVKLISESSTVRYIFEAIGEGNFDIENATSNATSYEWRCDVLCSSVYNDYALWCSRQSIKPEDNRVLGKCLSKLIPSSKKFRNTKGKRPYHYELPTLEKTRLEFQDSFNQDSSIWADNLR